MAFENAEEKKLYDTLAIEWVEYHKKTTGEGKEPMDFKTFYTRRGVSFKYEGKKIEDDIIVEVKKELKPIIAIPVPTGNNVQVEVETPVKTQDLKPVSDIATLRAEYKAKFGKNAYNGWIAEQLLEKLK